jgi:hypothetical protein
MTIETWPATLPNPIVDFVSEFLNGHQSGNEDESNIYPERTRRLPDKQASFSFYLSEDEFSEWKTFFNTTTINGSIYFSADWLSAAGYENCYARLLSGYYDAERIDKNVFGFWNKSWLASAVFEIISEI